MTIFFEQVCLEEWDSQFMVVTCDVSVLELEFIVLGNAEKYALGNGC